MPTLTVHYVHVLLIAPGCIHPLGRGKSIETAATSETREPTQTRVRVISEKRFLLAPRPVTARARGGEAGEQLERGGARCGSPLFQLGKTFGVGHLVEAVALAMLESEPRP